MPTDNGIDVTALKHGQKAMKGIGSEELRATIKTYVAGLPRQPVAGVLSTYLIFDPTETNSKHASPYGTPFYVGQGRFPARAQGHFRGDSGRATCKRFRQIYERGRHPLFLEVDRATTHLTSLYSELAWACHLVGLGYELTNGWAEHKNATPLKTIPVRRVWPFSIADAIADEVRLKIQCKGCGLRSPLPLNDVTWSDAPRSHLSDVKKAFVCPQCSQSRCLRLVVPKTPYPMTPNLADVLQVQNER